ncbi:hypothetical protein [Burkholderia ubonensis]|uniref:hypothetical protein n=1 Tax=Burkholderia ubonensis TaxID=101571 RepID=UPI0012F8A047|nr:hypothetical protein [Burkholderia ubonensis]
MSEAKMDGERDSIWPPYQAFYVQSMLFNSTSAVRSILRLDNIFEKLDGRPPAEGDVPARTILNEFQNMVLQAGALSRYFWPVPKASSIHQQRGRFLREVFSFGEESVLCNRDLRNALEHFDERLDKYLKEGIAGIILPEYVGHRLTNDGIPGHFFRAYFTDEGAFCLLGEEFLMQPLAEALIGVHNRLSVMDENGGMMRRFSAEPT